MEEEKKDLVKDVHWLACLVVQLEDSPDGGFMVHHNFESSLVVEMKSKQHLDPSLMELKESVLGKNNESFALRVWVCGVLMYQERLCEPNVVYLRNWILEKADGSRYSIHPHSTKMYHDHRGAFL